MLKFRYLPSNRDFVVVILIIVVAVSTQYLGDYYSGQMTYRQTSTSQSPPVNLRSIDLHTSSPSILPTPTAQPSNPSESTITVTPSPSPDSNPASILRLNLYKSYPTQSRQILQNIDWSLIVPGQKKDSPNIYLRNEGNVPVTMTFSPSDWVFRDASGSSLSQNYSQYFTLAWDYDNTKINVYEVRPVVFSLTVSPNLTDVASFSFNLVVTITSTK